MKFPIHLFPFLPAAVAAFAVGCGVSSAAEVQKADNTLSLTTSTSWVGGAIPGASDVAVWGSTLTADRSNALGGNQSWAGIKVTNPAGSLYTIANTASGTLSLGASGIDMSAATADLTIGAILNITSNQTWTVNAGRTLTISSAANSGTGTLSLAGSGTFSLNNSGAILGTGTLNLGNGINFTGNASRTISNVTNLNGNIGVAMTGGNALNFTGGLSVGSGTRVMTLANATGGATTATLIFGGGGASKEITGSGQLVFENGNAADSPVLGVRFGIGADVPLVRADVSIGSGVSVFFSAADSFTADSDLTVQSGGVFNMSGNAGSAFSQTVGSLAGSGTVTDGATVTNKVAILTIDGQASTATTTFSGNIITGAAGSSVGITKKGASTQVLSGANNYYGQTLVNAGTLLVNGTHAGTFANAGLQGYTGTTAGNYQVSSGATLGGSGRIAGNNGGSVNSNMILVESGGVLAPGASVGTLKLDGANISGTGSRVLNMASGAKFSFELAGDGSGADQVAFWNYVNGDLLLNNNAINLSLNGLLVQGTYTVTLFTFYSDSGLTLTNGGILSGLTIGTLGAGIVGTPTLNFNAGGNSIELTYSVIPEPGSVLLLGLGLGVTLLRRRSRQAGSL